MRCENCSFEPVNAEKEAWVRYREEVENRLVTYGYSEKMNPKKYQASAAVRKVISIITGMKGKPGGSMPAADVEKSLDVLDHILPRKG